MVKTVLGVKHQGFRDWVVQRISAIIMAVYSITLIAYLVICPIGSYAEWRALFTPEWMKIATMMFVVSILFHAWIGMWTIFTDYVKPFVIRCILELFVFLILSACFFWGLLIVWSV
jgi:succinate dehydrogenase / fumarate reductase membrane anchor subunit